MSNLAVVTGRTTRSDTADGKKEREEEFIEKTEGKYKKASTENKIDRERQLL